MGCGCRNKKKPKDQASEPEKVRVVYAQRGSQPDKRRLDERVRMVRKKK